MSTNTNDWTLAAIEHMRARPHRYIGAPESLRRLSDGRSGRPSHTPTMAERIAGFL